MKVLIINKSDSTGGAAIAAKRLTDALQNSGVEVKMLVQEKKSTDPNVIHTGNSFFKKKWNFVLFVIERLYFFWFEKSKSLRFAFSPAIAGENIVENQWVKEADVIHLHWFNQGYLSINGLRKLVNLQKTIVWTMHDMWAFTGGCHYSGDCINYRNNCGNCKLLNKPATNDLSSRILKKKKKILKDANIKYVACSNWLAQKAMESSLLKGCEVKTIANPIDTRIFYAGNKLEIRKELGLPVNRKIILFGSANATDKRKGIDFLLEALDIILVGNAALLDNIHVVIFGKSGETIQNKIKFQSTILGLISENEKIAKVYNVADIFVLPSLEDNLPNTIMESMACGTPVVAFNTGGIPEMVDHMANGYLADYKSAHDLACGIKFILEHEQPALLSKKCIEKVEMNYTQNIIARKYQDLYLKANTESMPFS
ncbi:MAG: glycosyltransferase family 4 protein [Bacteroidales bacterium]